MSEPTLIVLDVLMRSGSLFARLCCPLPPPAEPPPAPPVEPPQPATSSAAASSRAGTLQPRLPVDPTILACLLSLLGPCAAAEVGGAHRLVVEQLAGLVAADHMAGLEHVG